MRNVARKGDPTSMGGVIQDGDGGWLTEGAPTTYIGMIATCPACKVGQGPIVAVGPRSIIGPGGPVALQGDYVACGCPPMSNTILPAQGTTVGDNQGPRARAASAPAETPAPAPASSPATPLVPLVDPTEHRIYEYPWSTCQKAPSVAVTRGWGSWCLMVDLGNNAAMRRKGQY